MAPNAFKLSDPRTLAASELERGIRHHRRAITALDGAGFKSLSDSVRGPLLDRLRTDLQMLENELARRSTDAADGEARSAA